MHFEMVKTVKMYAKKVAAVYDPPQQSSVGGHHHPQHSQKLASMGLVSVCITPLEHNIHM